MSEYPQPDPTNDAGFFKCLDVVDREEGGYADDPDDPGGATNHGITQTTYDHYRTSRGLPIQPVKQISDEEETDCYYNDYWLAFGCNMKPLPMGLCVFQACVNMRPKTVRRMMLNANGDWHGFLGLQKQEYARIIVMNPRLAKFKNGWLARVERTRSVAGTL